MLQERQVMDIFNDMKSEAQKDQCLHTHTQCLSMWIYGPSEDDCAPTLILFWSISRLVWSYGLKVSGPNDSVPFAGAVRTDSPHVYFILRLGCLVSLSSNVINARSQDPAVARLMNSSAAPHSPPSYPSSRCQIKTAWEKRERGSCSCLYVCFTACNIPLLHYLVCSGQWFVLSG